MAYALLSLFAGALALWMARKVYTAVRIGRSWPSVPGRILERGVGSPMKAHGRSYLPHVKYRYTVDGTDYTNDQVYAVGSVGGYRERVQKLVDGLPDPLPVRYDPQDPARSFLLLNPGWIAWLSLAFGVFAILLALVQAVTS